MCGIRFNHEEFSEQCYHCGKLGLEEELFFYSQWGVWLCQDCQEKAENKKIQINTNYQQQKDAK